MRPGGWRGRALLNGEAITEATRPFNPLGTPDMLRAEIVTPCGHLTWRMVTIGGLVVAAVRRLG